MSSTMSCVCNKRVETMTGSAEKGILNIQGAAEASLRATGTYLNYRHLQWRQHRQAGDLSA